MSHSHTKKTAVTKFSSRNAQKENTSGKVLSARRPRPSPYSGAQAAKSSALGNKTNSSVTNISQAQFQTELDKLRAENMALKTKIQQTALTTPGVLVPRPIKKKGTSVRMVAAMGLLNNRDLYNAIRRCVRFSAARAGIDFKGRWRDQDREKIALVIASVRERFRFLNKFSQIWPVEEILKIQLKNHRQYVRRLTKEMEEVLGDEQNGMEIDLEAHIAQHEQAMAVEGDEDPESAMVEDDNQELQADGIGEDQEMGGGYSGESDSEGSEM